MSKSSEILGEDVIWLLLGDDPATILEPDRERIVSEGRVRDLEFLPDARVVC
jgi:hypothetical protein